MALSPRVPTARAAALLAAAAASLCLGSGQAAGDPPAPAVRLEADAGSSAYGTVEAIGLDPAVLAGLRREDPPADRWAEIFPVYTGSEVPAPGAQPPVAGSWAVVDGVLRFTPRYALVPGLPYSARLDLGRLRQLATGARSSAPPIEATLSLPGEDLEPSTLVREVYPTADELPANLLRLYLHFSAPMSRGEAYEHIRLLDAEGRALEQVFLEVGEELWDRGQRRLTLFFDPGRIKRGLRPHLEAGPPLTAGRSYRLVIDPAWRDGDGLPLVEGFEKFFTVTAPDRESPNPDDWRIAPPAAGGRDPLELRFPEPLDRGLLMRVLRVRDAAGEPVAGTVEVTDSEKLWRFVPRRPWRAGAYTIEVDSILEDLAGNNLNQVFDVDVTSDSPGIVGRETLSLPFDVGAPGRGDEAGGVVDEAAAAFEDGSDGADLEAAQAFAAALAR